MKNLKVILLAVVISSASLLSAVQHEGHTMPAPQQDAEKKSAAKAPKSTKKVSTKKKAAAGASNTHAGHDMNMSQPEQSAPTQSNPHAGHDMNMPPAQPVQSPATPVHSDHQMPSTPSTPKQGEHQMQGMEGMDMSMPMKSFEELLRDTPSNLLPQLSQSDTSFGAPTRLEDLQKIAEERNPTLKQANAEVRAAQGRRLQAGLYPNPTVGYTGEEIRGGASRGGQQGFFVEQAFVLGGKLGLSRNVAGQELRIAELEAEEQRMRVSNSVRLAFFETLASQEMLRLDSAFVQLAQQTLATAQRLQNIGVRDATEVMQAEIALQKTELRLKRQQNQHRQQWRSLAALVGDPLLSQGTLIGRLEDLPNLDHESLVKSLLSESPAVKIAAASVDRAGAALKRAQREPVPDLLFRGGLQHNRELNDAGKPVGAQGFAEVGISLPIFNRNQGNVQAANAEIERAKSETSRIQLLLRERAAVVARSFDDARDTVSQYQKEIVPRAQRIYQTQLKAWGQMAVSYPGVLQAQDTLFEVQSEYITALRDAQVANVTLRGFLLTDGLEAPARPSDVEMPIREINLPSSRGGSER